MKPTRGGGRRSRHEGRRGRPKKTQGSTVPALKSVRRALDVLELAAARPGRARDAAQALDESWATLHRALTELERGGFLQRDPQTNVYRIGPRAWFVGTAYLNSHPVLKAAQPHLEAAAEGQDYTVQLVERFGRLAVTLYSHHSTGEAITKATHGYHFPLHCGSKGQVLLAFAPSSVEDEYLAEPLERLTPETITEPAALRERLAEIRERGYAKTEGDVQLFTGSVAAPVFDQRRQAVAAICFITRRSRLKDPHRVEETLETLLNCAEAVSIALGWQPGIDATGEE